MKVKMDPGAEKIDPEVMAKAQAGMRAQQESKYGQGENPIRYHIVCDKRFGSQFMAAYLYWCLMELMDGNTERVKFYEGLSEIPLTELDGENDEIYVIDSSACDKYAVSAACLDMEGIAPNMTEYVVITHPYQIWHSLVKELSYYPYAETVQCFYGFIKEDGTLDGKNDTYAKHFRAGMSLFDIKPDNSMFWASLFSEEKWLIEDYEPGDPLTFKEEADLAEAANKEEAPSEDTERKFDKYASKTAKKRKRLEKEALEEAMKNRKVSKSAAKPHRLFRQEVYNAGLILDSRNELVDRYFIDNFNYPATLTLDEVGVDLRVLCFGYTEINDHGLLQTKIDDLAKTGDVYAGWVLSTRINADMAKLVMKISLPNEATKKEFVKLLSVICTKECIKAAVDCSYRLSIFKEKDGSFIAAGTVVVDILSNPFA